MRRIGHRGAMGHATPNTLASFEKAIALGCDELETDVWLTDDGRLLISHDPPALDATLVLDRVLDLCRGRIVVNLELKAEQSEGRARQTGAAVARHLAARGDPDVYLSSFWWAALAAAQDAAPAVRRAFVLSDSPDREALLRSAAALGLSAVHPERAYATPELVTAAHAASLKVNVWTVNDEWEIATLRGWGVDGVISDYPERVPKG